MASPIMVDFADHKYIQKIYFAAQYYEKLICSHGFYELFP